MPNSDLKELQLQATGGRTYNAKGLSYCTVVTAAERNQLALQRVVNGKIRDMQRL